MWNSLAIFIPFFHQHVSDSLPKIIKFIASLKPNQESIFFASDQIFFPFLFPLLIFFSKAQKFINYLLTLNIFFISSFEILFALISLYENINIFYQKKNTGLVEMDEVLGIRPITSSIEQLGLLMSDEFSPTETEKRATNFSLEPIQDSLGFPTKMRVFLRMRSLTPHLNSNVEDQEEIFVVLNSTTLLTKIPIAEGTSSRRSRQPNSVETQNIRKYRFTNIFTSEVSQSEFFQVFQMWQN